MDVFHVLVVAEYAAILIIHSPKFSNHYNSDAIRIDTASLSSISYYKALQIYVVYCSR